MAAGWPIRASSAVALTLGRQQRDHPGEGGAGRPAGRTPRPGASARRRCSTRSCSTTRSSPAATPAGRSATCGCTRTCDRLTVLAAQPGWAWAPADRYTRTARRTRRTSAASPAARSPSLAADGPDGAMAAFEVEWVARRGRRGRRLRAGHPRARLRADPAGRAVRTTCATCSPRWTTRASRWSSSTPSTRPGSSSCPSPPRTRSAPPTPSCWCGRRSGRSARATACAPRSRPKVLADGVGNGGHVHLSSGATASNLFTGGDRPASA